MRSQLLSGVRGVGHGVRLVRRELPELAEGRLHHLADSEKGEATGFRHWHQKRPGNAHLNYRGELQFG